MKKTESYFNIRLILATALLSFTLFGCAKPTDTVIPANSDQWDTQLVPKLDKLSPEERKLAAGYLTRTRMGEIAGGSGVPVGTTLEQAIEDQRQWIAKQKEAEARAEALKAKLAAEQARIVDQMNEAVTVTLLEKSQIPSDFRAGRIEDKQVIQLGIKNTSAKELAGVSGKLAFIDVFGKSVGSIHFDISENIAPGADYIWTGSRSYNQFIDEHRAIWNLKEGKYTTRFTPGTVVYADGTKLELPDSD